MTAKQIRESVMDKLAKKGISEDVYKGLVDDFVWYWQQEKAMQKDIQKRGRTYEAISSTGKKYEKNNPSVKDALLYSKQMLAILEAMGLNAKSVEGKDFDDDPL